MSICIASFFDIAIEICGISMKVTYLNSFAQGRGMQQQTDSKKGLFVALLAYSLWGFLPLYMKAVAHIPSLEVVAHRVLWSVPVAGVILLYLRRTQDIWTALRSPRIVGLASITAVLIALNWLTYVYAIAVDRALEAALGYYINPLFSIFLSAVILGERLNRLQMVAILCAVAAVAVLAYEVGTLPWISVALAGTWGVYALFKRTLPIGPNQGFLLEALLLSPAALAYVILLGQRGTGFFGATSMDTLLLMGCGVVTAVPLIIYAHAAKMVRLSTIAVMQYIAPTLIFLVAVFVFKEEVTPAKMIAFPLIWTALVIYSVALWRERAQH